MAYMCKFYRQVLVLGNPSIYNGAYGVLFSKANLRDGLRNIKKIVTYICGVGASSISRFYFGLVLIGFWAGISTLAWQPHWPTWQLLQLWPGPVAATRVDGIG